MSSVAGLGIAWIEQERYRTVQKSTVMANKKKQTFKSESTIIKPVDEFDVLQHYPGLAFCNTHS